MQICECAKPQPRPSAQNPAHKVCATCGQWWMPEQGSRKPAPMNTITDADWQRELTTARARPNLMSAKIAKLANSLR